MKRVDYKITYIIAALVAILFFIFSSFVVGGGLEVNAATSADVAAAKFEQSNIWDDLQGSMINGNGFDLEDYPHNDNGKPQIISFIEFGYSSFKDKQSGYGLYVYVYNPQDIAIDMDTERNQIEFSYVNGEYEKYHLLLLNYSSKAGYEGRFYKFKVVLTDMQRTAILKSVKQDERIYEVIGIELSIKNIVTDYSCLQTYKYSGFALGYGSELATENTLTCKVDGVDKYLTLDVHSTYYRPKGFNGESYTQDTLHSVYFSVPNKIVDEYGELTAVHATWLNALTNPVFVTGNSSVFNSIDPYIGVKVNGGNYKWANSDNSPVRYSLIASAYAASASWNNASYGRSYMSYNANSYLTNSDKTVDTLHYAFLAENGDADKFTLPAEVLLGNRSDGVKGYFETYTDEHGGELVNDRFSKALFESVDTEFVDMNITADDTFRLTDQDVSLSWWDRVVGGGYHIKGKSEYEISAIKKVTGNDFKSTPTETCKGLYIDESDYKEFLDYYNSSKKRGETVYLFRYYQSPYTAYEVVEYRRSRSEWYEEFGQAFEYEYVDTNAYFMQMWVQLDFDIIDVTFTKDGVSTVIPVVMSPVDLGADGTPPVITTSDDKISWWKIILAILLLIVLLIFLIPVLPYIFQFIVWIVVVPFKALAKLIKNTGEMSKERKRRREERKQKGAEKETEPKGRKVKKKLKFNENMNRDEIESYLDSIDWNDPIWTQINGSE